MSDDWKESLSEDVRGASELENIESVEALAKSHIESSKALNSRMSPIKSDMADDKVIESLGKFSGIKDKSDYSLGDISSKDIVEDLAYSLKIHPKQAVKFYEGLENLWKEKQTAGSKDNKTKWQEESKKSLSEIKNLDVVKAQAASKLGKSLEKLQDDLGSYYYHPVIQKLMSIAGADKKTTTSTSPATTAPGGGGGNEDRDVAQKKVNYVAEALNASSDHPYKDKSHKEYEKTREKVSKYMKDLKEYQKKTGEQVDLMGRGL